MARQERAGFPVTWREVGAAALLEAGMLGLAALLGYATHHPLVFASLGPTAFEVIETPDRPSARLYNVLAGHALGIVAGLAALGLTHAWSAPAVSAAGVPGLRVAAIVVASLLTVGATLAARATQPAALSTTLLIATGVMQAARSVVCIAAAVLLFGMVGEPIRRYRLRVRDAARRSVR